MRLNIERMSVKWILWNRGIESFYTLYEYQSIQYV